VNSDTEPLKASKRTRVTGGSNGPEKGKDFPREYPRKDKTPIGSHKLCYSRYCIFFLLLWF
jgi:hypothetical protein